MKSDFILAINQLCTERKLSREVVLETVETALITAYKRNFGAAANIEARIDPNTGDVRVFATKEVVETVLDRKTQISLDEARQADPAIEIGQEIQIESTPHDFGRIAAQTAKQVILQRIREAERDAQYTKFADSAGEIVLGTVQSHDFHTGDVVVNMDGAEALLPSREQVPGERYARGSRLRAYVVDVRRGNRGAQITLSRRSYSLLRRLLELEVPEIFHGTVEIKGIAREAGSRSKVAVHATQEGVDPVGSCVGVRGGRIQSIVNELRGEKIDVVQWDSDVAAFIANALSPAKVMNVLLADDSETGKTATVIVPDRQLSLAIGKEGQNARLAAKLTGWRIDIKSATETAEETLGRLEDVIIPPEEMDILTLAESLLRRPASERTPEEQILIEADLAHGDEIDLAWPEQEPAVELKPKVETARGEGPQPAAQVEATDAAVAVEAQAGEAEAALDVEGAELVDLSGAETDVGEEVALPVGVFDDTETEPTFEGEPVEDSLGWAFTKPPEDFVYGWEEEEEQPVWEPDWEEALLEEEEGLPPEDKRKKKKKRGRRSSDFEEEGDSDYESWSRRG